MSTEELHAAIRAWAKGIYPLEAGAELLCRTRWAQSLHGAGYVEVSERDGEIPAYGWPKVGDYVKANHGYLSGGERRQLLVISSFLGQDRSTDGDEATGAHPWACSLYEDLSGVDKSFIYLVQSAVGHAAGLHEMTGGNPLPWLEL